MTVLEHQGTGTLLAISSKLDIDLADPLLPRDFLDRARGFAVVADAAMPIMQSGVGRALPTHALIAPIAFLLAQSIELTLKAFLLEKGYPFDKLMSEIGHSIPKAIERAEQLGLSAHHTYDKHVCDLLDKAYRSENGSAKKLQYPSRDGFMLIPSLRALRELTAQITEEIAIALWGRSNYDLVVLGSENHDGLTIPSAAVYSGPSLNEQRAKWQSSVATVT
jgi:hypothetical protein